MGWFNLWIIKVLMRARKRIQYCTWNFVLPKITTVELWANTGRKKQINNGLFSSAIMKPLKEFPHLVVLMKFDFLVSCDHHHCCLSKRIVCRCSWFVPFVLAEKWPEMKFYYFFFFWNYRSYFSPLWLKAGKETFRPLVIDEFELFVFFF